MTVITFPDAEALVVEYLTDKVDAHVSTRVPNPRPERLVRVILTGSARRTLTHEDAQVTVECWSPSAPDARDLAADVYGWLGTLDVNGAHVPQGPDGWLGGPYSEPDPETGTPRYVMTVIVRQRTVGG